MRGKITALLAAAAAAIGTAGAAIWARGRTGDERPDLEVSGTTLAPSDMPAEPAAGEPPAAVPTPAQGATPPAASAASAGGDDLTAIRGLGKVKAAKLVAAGVTGYAQIAAWTDDDIAEMGLVCNTSPGQIRREDWVGQAKALAAG